MEYTVLSRLVDEVTGDIIGYEIKGDKNDSIAAVTYDKAKELGVEDLEDVEYLDIENRKVVVYNGKYGLCDMSKMYMSDLSDISYDKIDSDKVCIYGYVFSTLNLLPLDNDFAIRRLFFDREEI